MINITDEDRMDWLVRHDVNVRTPLRHGSKELFTAQTTSDEESETYQTSLRRQIDEQITEEMYKLYRERK